MPRSTPPSVWKRLTRSRLTMFFGVVLAVVVIVSFAREALRRYEVRQEIARLEGQVAQLQERKTNLTNLIDYFESPLFQEQEARQKLGLAKPGETVVVVPSTNAAITQSTGVLPPTIGDAKKEANPTKWWKYFFEESNH